MDESDTEQSQQAEMQGWPSHFVPIEIVDNIAGHLKREDIANLRLVNRELAVKLERAYFGRSVVAFTPDFYLTKSCAESDIGIFEKLGGQIHKFGITFEFDETLLQKLPKKDREPGGHSFWGSYDWPDDEYIPFAHTKQLEGLGEQKNRLRKAFSKLKNLNELAICVNNGLGFLDPEVSRDMTSCPEMYVYSFKEGPVVFKTKHPTIGGHGHSFRDGVATSGSRVAPACTRHVSTSESVGEPAEGHFLMSNTRASAVECYPMSPTASQVELLTETSWAIQAFLTSLVCAVTDNGAALRNIRTLNFSCISSGVLHHFNRSSFFTSFPQLSNMTLLVVGDWKSPNANGRTHCLETNQPFNACLQLRKLLDDQIVHISNLKALTLGYIGGGEHDTGSAARNSHVLPAPVAAGTAFPVVNGWLMPDSSVVFGHVKNLTFENCWFSPEGLGMFMKDCEQTGLEHITFDSCSLTIGYHEYARQLFSDEGKVVVTRDKYYDQGVRKSSWPALINSFTPGDTIAEQKQKLTKSFRQPEESVDRIRIPSLKVVQFISCGYVTITVSHRPFFDFEEVVTESEMKLSPCEMLGEMLIAIGDDETLLLDLAFGMTVGQVEYITMDSDSDSDVISGAADHGRFSGSISAVSLDGDDRAGSLEGV